MAADPVMRTMLVGAPGCGKGTQSPGLVSNLGVCHIATGDALRAAVSAGTPAGKAAKGAMDAGKLVTDDIVTNIVTEAMEKEACKKGFVLDGFPRTINQAKILDDILAKKGQKLGLPCGKHFMVYTEDDAGATVVRAYTPTTGDEVTGYVELVVKVYRPLPPKFPAGGVQSQLLGDLEVGDDIHIRGPIGHIEYRGAGAFALTGGHARDHGRAPGRGQQPSEP